VLVAAIGGALGVCAALALRGWIVHGGGGLAFFDLSIDTSVFVEAAAITLTTGIVAGVAPALYETRRLQTNPLRAMARSDRVRQRWRHALVVFEITVTVALLVVTTSMVDAYRRARSAQMGYSTQPLMTARVENPSGVPTTRILDVLNGLPGVAEAAASTVIPFASSGRPEKVSADATGASAVEAESGAISAGFFSTLGVPMRAGRAFSRRDSALTRTAIVNESLARLLFPGGDAVGGHIWVAQTSYDIVGIVADHSRHPLRRGGADPKVFLPLALDSKDVARLHFLVRATGDPAHLVNTVRRETRDAAAGSVVTGAFTIDQIMTVMGQEILVGTALLFPLISIGMLLTAAGIYGVLSFAMTRRCRELAVRIAVGASASDLVRLVAAHTLRLVATGCACGVLATLLLSRVVRSGGGAGSIFDPPAHAFVVPVLIVLSIGALATWIPSRRALRIDPVVVLRSS
jgi:MacB-like periplasmic core domain